MKLPITNQFLWDLHSVVENAGRLLGPRRTVLSLLPHNRNLVYEKYRKEMGARQFGKFVDYMKRTNCI